MQGRRLKKRPLATGISIQLNSKGVNKIGIYGSTRELKEEAGFESSPDTNTRKQQLRQQSTCQSKSSIEEPHKDEMSKTSKNNDHCKNKKGPAQACLG